MYALIYLAGFVIVLVFGIVDTIQSSGKLTFSDLVEVLGTSFFSVLLIALFMVVTIISGVVGFLNNVTLWEK